MKAPRTAARAGIAVLAAVAGLGWGTAEADPAAGAIEDFSAGTAGWTNRPGDVLAIHFSAVGQPDNALAATYAAAPPLPDSGVVRVATNASGGLFTGDYLPVYATVAGWRFDLLAQEVLPSAVSVRFSDGTHTFRRSVSADVSSVGVWSSLFVPLSGRDGWWGSTNAVFSNVLANVTSIDVQITRNGGQEQSYLVDNFMVAHQLTGTGSTLLTPLSGGPFHIQWGGLKPGVTYDVQSTTNLPGTNWITVGTFVATNGVAEWMHTVVTNDAARRFYRLRYDAGL